MFGECVCRVSPNNCVIGTWPFTQEAALISIRMAQCPMKEHRYLPSSDGCCRIARGVHDTHTCLC